MAKKSETTTPVVTRKLALFLVLFYIIYYVLSIILVGAFGVEWTRLGGFPFRTAMSEFNPEAGGGALGAWLAMVITYVLSLLLAYFVVRATKRTWDYMITTSFIHWVICCLVNQQFPVNWIWISWRPPSSSTATYVAKFQGPLHKFGYTKSESSHTADDTMLEFKQHVFPQYKRIH